MTINFNDLLIQTDKLCDCMPVVSTLSNLINLFQKTAIFIASLSDEEHQILNNHYYVHLKDKHPFRCITLLLPLFGNLTVIAYDFIKKDQMITAIQQDSMMLQYASEELQDDWVQVYFAVQKNGIALQFASKKLQNNRFIVNTAIRQNGMALQYASEKLQSDSIMVNIAVLQNPRACQFSKEAPGG